MLNKVTKYSQCRFIGVMGTMIVILIIVIVSIISCIHCRNVGYNNGYSDGYEDCKKNFAKIDKFKSTMRSKFLEKLTR